MKGLFQFGCVVAALLMALGAAPRASAYRYFGQRGRGARQARPVGQRAMPRAQRQVRRQENKPGVRGVMGLQPKWIEKLQKMPPEQQEHFLENNRRFQNLAPQRQAQIRRTLRRWNQMTPEQRQAMKRRLQIFKRLSPEERREVVQNIAPRWKALPQRRKQALTRRMHVLAGMTPQERQQALQDPQFMRGLDANEQDLLRKITNLRLGPAPGQ